jgi:hypothetical protein
MTSMKSAMDEDMVALTKRGYISKSNITISTTQAQQNTGKTNLYCTYSPADLVAADWPAPTGPR